jgi:predicted anti-sigma-YlaC factor YlaD
MTHDNCHHLLDDLSDFLDGAATDEVCAEIERHLADCENCRVMLDTLNKTIVLYRDLPQPKLPESARQRLYQALDLNEFLPNG